MRTLITFILFLTASFNALHAQQTTLRGRITNDAGEGLDGDILITAPANDSVVKVGYYEKGQVMVPAIPLKQFRVKISSFNHADTSFIINAINDDADFGTIVLSRVKKMETATVKGRAPLFTKTAEGTKINVENTMLSSSITATDLLSKSPGLIMEKGKVSVFGRGQALIYLNGKPIPFEVMQSLPVNRIRSVEVITNPSAKYEASGMAVINIITKKGVGPNGFVAEITQSSTFARYYLNDAGFNFNYKKNKISITGDYSSEQGYDWLRAHFWRSFNYPSGKYLNEGFHEEKTINTYNFYRFGINYVPGKRSDISIQYNGIHNENAPDVNIDNQINVPGQTQSRVFTFNNAFNGNYHHSVNVNYNYALDSLGSNLFAGVQYGTFHNRLLDQIEEHVIKSNTAQPGSMRETNGDNRIELFAAQMDLVRMFKNDRKLEAGVRMSDVTNKGLVTFRSRPLTGETWTYYPQFANNFIYKEKVPAAYLQFYGRLGKKWDYVAGLRAEYSDVSGYSRILNKQVTDTSYLNIFPNLRLQHNMSDNWSFAFSYSGRIERPAYQDIDPFVWYLDSLTSVQGNPQLIPELLGSAEVAVTFKKYTLRLNYVHAKNSFRRLAFTGSAGINSVIYRNTNIDLRQLYQATLEAPVEAGNWSTYTSLSFGMEKFTDPRTGYVQNEGLTPQLYIYSTHQYKIPRIAELEVTGQYFSSKNNGYIYAKPKGTLALGIGRSFFDKKLSVRLIAEDLLQTNYIIGGYTVGHITSEYNSRVNSHLYRITFKYRFGRLDNVTYKNKSVNDAEFNRLKI